MAMVVPVMMAVVVPVMAAVVMALVVMTAAAVVMMTPVMDVDTDLSGTRHGRAGRHHLQARHTRCHR